MLLDVGDLREDYTLSTLDMETIDPDPYIQFKGWFKQVQDAKLPEPNAMILSTASLDGRPSARTVLLKGLDEDGFIFYSNYEIFTSKKRQHAGREVIFRFLKFWIWHYKKQ